MTLPPPPHTQARHSSTFKAPLLDGSVTLPEIYEWHLHNSPAHRLFVLTGDDGTKQTIYWSDAIRAIHVGAKLIRDLTGGRPGSVVAIISASETISYWTLLMSVMRANCVPFTISPRNSAAAVAHLLCKVEISYILIGREQAMLDLTNNALALLSDQKTMTLPPITTIPLFQDFFVTPAMPAVELQGVPYDRKPTDGAIYLHSSGSTAFPKPVLWTHLRLIHHCHTPWFGERDLTDLVLSLAVIPMYHGMGIMSMCWAASSGLVISTFEPKSPPQLPTPEGLYHSAKASDTDIVFCVPAFLEAWAHKPEYVQWLATRSGVLWGGGPLHHEAGDYMVSQGVSMFNLYGSTEAGIISTVVEGQVDTDWQYFKISGQVALKMIPQGDNTFELVAMENSHCRPSVVNTKVDGVDAYATSDLVVPHPTKLGYYRIYGRADDQIIHSTGEKTNPGPLEKAMNQHPRVVASVVFGRGRFQAGIIVEPKPEFKFDPANQVQLANFRNKVWPTVEKMNAFAPQHSRIFKEMILVTKPSKPFTYTAKNTPRRHAIIEEYEDEINKLYDVVEESTQNSIVSPTEWDARSALKFVHEVVGQVLVDTLIGDSDDLFFQHGCDSLKATWIRNTLLRALQESSNLKLDIRKATDNFVYSHPTVAKLTSFVCGATGIGNGDQICYNIVHEMLALVSKYSADLPEPSIAEKLAVEKDVVILTGTTGSVGSHTLVALANDDKVRHIYALNRRNKNKSLRERHEGVFTDRGLPCQLLQSDKITFLEVDFTAVRFGLESGLYHQMQGTVTHIIHNAWRVDFNLALASFEFDLKVLRCMLDFALTSPILPNFMFISSIGLLRNTANLPSPIQENAVPAETAVGTGYTESKWVGEAMLTEAAKNGLSTLVVRLGQVAGATNGAWSSKEWFPSLVQASYKLGYFPSFKEDRLISWLPAQKIAGCLAEFRRTPTDVRFVHLVHPRPSSWDKLVNFMATDLKLDTVSYPTWLQKLEAVDADQLQSLNAVALLPYFRYIGGRNAEYEEAFGLPPVDLMKASSVSQSLRDPALRRIGEEDMKGWISYWQRVGMLNI